MVFYKEKQQLHLETDVLCVECQSRSKSSAGEGQNVVSKE